MSLQQKIERHNILKSILVISLLFVFFSCTNKSQTITLWTDRPEFALYAEIFNASSSQKVLVVYKETLNSAFPISKDEKKPDLVVGSWLESTDLKKNFYPLNNLLNDKKLPANKFYSNLLNVGLHDEKYYLLPVSFNLPCVIFDSEQGSKLSDDYFLTLEELKNISKEFNVVNKSKLYTRMGFAPSWDSDFLYMASKMQGTNFTENGKTLSWNEGNLKTTVDFIKNWTLETNQTTTNEEDFKFKYLYTPKVKWITEHKTMFAYSTSKKLFSNSTEKLADIDFRWLIQDSRIPLEDEIVTIGMYKNSKNLKTAEVFLTWFFDEENQHQILETIQKMNLVSTSFGIAGGFSSVKAVNESVYPSFYPTLLRNLPKEANLSVATKLPTNWESLKERVIKPYLETETSTQEDKESVSMEQLVSDWQKQFY